jgi:hypothetical protein
MRLQKVTKGYAGLSFVQGSIVREDAVDPIHSASKDGADHQREQAHRDRCR